MSTNVASEEPPSSSRRRLGALILFGVVVLVSLFQLYVGVFLVPRFTEIYRDMLGNHPLPSSTAIVLQCRWVLVGFAFIWPLVGVFLLRQRALQRYLVIVLAVLILSLAFTTIALVLPLSGTILKSAPPVQLETPAKSNEER